MKTKVTYPKTDQPVRVESKAWAIVVTDCFDVERSVIGYLEKPGVVEIDSAIQSCRKVFLRGAKRKVWLYEIQVLTNGDIWLQKKLQATITKDD